MRPVEHGLSERTLQWRHFGECPARRFTTHVSLLTNAQHNGIGVVAKLNGRGDARIVAIDKLNAGRMRDVGAGQGTAQARDYTHTVFRSAGGPPTATHLDSGIAERSDHAEASWLATQRQRLTVILQHHDGARTNR